MTASTPTSVRDTFRVSLRSSGKVLPEHARAHNRALVLQHLFHHGPTSRADLARATGLTRVTVSDLVSVLLVAGLVEELGTRSEGRVGKPAVLVGMRTEDFRVVVVDVGTGDDLIGGVTDLQGRFMVRRRIGIGDREGEALVAHVARFCRGLLAAADRPVIGIGVAAPGIIHGDGTVEDAPWRGWLQLPLADRLTELLAQPVHVVNDADAAVLCERTFGGTRATGVMVVRVCEGVGAGIVLDGALVRGHADAAGEIGHVRVVEEGGVRCRCGRRGCLQTVLSVDALTERFDGLDAGARRAASEELGLTLARVLAPVVGALDLTEVVLSGPSDLLDGALRETTEKEVRDRSMPAIGERFRVRMAALGEDDVLAGAAVLVLSRQLGVS